MAEIIQANSYELGSLYDGASLSVWNDVVKRILSHAEETKTNSELPMFLSQIYQRGVDAGFGAEDRAALVKILTDPD
jgi:3-hydroxyisobutyrate dehydrogenase-like beta-hydroxyacid dehydrogenase